MNLGIWTEYKLKREFEYKEHLDKCWLSTFIQICWAKFQTFRFTSQNKILNSEIHDVLYINIILLILYISFSQTWHIYVVQISEI